MTMMRRPGRGIVLAVATASVVVSCGAGGPAGVDDPPVGSAGTADPTGQVVVMAAASLTEPLEDLAASIERDHPGLDVVLSFGPSSGLVEQVLAGAPADVLATADTSTMRTAQDAGALGGAAQVFARNALTVAVPAGNPGEVTGLVDLARDDLRIAVCEPQVPCGAAAEEMLDRAGVTAAPDTLTADVKEAMTLVTLGEVDAALVYRSDIAAAGSSAATEIPVDRSDTVVNEYPIAVLSDAPNPAGAAAVIDAVTSEEGRQALLAAGFLEP
jgi:molybdate transport system substrate-binding protein